MSPAVRAAAGIDDPHHPPTPGERISVPHANHAGGLAGDTERERETDAEWAEDLALRVLLDRVRPERRDEAAERVRSVLRDFETGRPTARRRLPRMIGIARRQGG
jgi:hypothetical protein